MLATPEYWRKVYDAGDDCDWYYDNKAVGIFIQECIPNFIPPFPIVLHCGCGASDLIESISKYITYPGYCVHTDIIESILGRVRRENRGLDQNFVCADAKLFPFQSASFDIILEKGLFDSLTADMNSQKSNATSLLSEYARLLRPGGMAIIISIFGPNGEDKDMFGLLCHSDLTVQLTSIPIPPAEIPSQNFGFIYLLTLER